MWRFLLSFLKKLFGLTPQANISVLLPMDKKLLCDIVYELETSPVMLIETRDEPDACIVCGYDKIVGDMSTIRFLGRLSGLYPTDAYECAREDSMLDVLAPLLESPSPELIHDVLQRCEFLEASNSETLSYIFWNTAVNSFIEDGRTDLMERLDWCAQYTSDKED